MLLSVESPRDSSEKYTGIGFHSGFGSSSFKMGPIKMLLDGAMKGETAAMRESYSHKADSYGILTYEQEEVNDIVLRSHLDNYQFTAHAIGDKAVVQLLDAYENAFRIKPNEDARFRIEHCAVIDDEIIDRIREMELVPVVQPVFMYSLGDTYNEFLGERAEYAMCAKSFLDKDIKVAFGTDCSICDANPFLNLYAACVRKTDTGAPIGQSQRVGILDAIRMYTYNSAYAAFEEDIKGSIEVGKLADIVIASRNLLETDPEDLRDVEVLMSMIDGEVVYRKRPEIER
jgi:predicted amidohydrolase YtcJ